MITSGIEALGPAAVAGIIAAVASFDAFTGDNDPYGEHDCALRIVDGISVPFKVDYYDRDLVYHSPDPSDPSGTQRVMTVMRADGYCRSAPTIPPSPAPYHRGNRHGINPKTTARLPHPLRKARFINPCFTTSSDP